MFENYFSLITTTVLQILKNWWWLPLPFILQKPLLYQYKWWRKDVFLSKHPKVVLEVKLPKEVLKPIRAMEEAMASIHGGTYKPADWWEKWIDGEVQLSTHFELVSIDGNPHFFIRTPRHSRDLIEASIYAQYPEAEISEVDDYVKKVPQNLPNKDWDMFGSDYKLLLPDYYPIKTYQKFETEHEIKEEKRIDPLASLMEGFSKLKPGEQFWVQIQEDPLSGEPKDEWVAEVKKLRDKLARRQEKPKKKPIIQEMAEILFTGKVGEPPVEKDIIPPEMKLTPGEREIVAAIEQKISKPVFEVNIRFIYMGKKEVWYQNNWRLAMSFFNNFMTLNLNGLVPLGQTLSKVHKTWFLPLNIIRNRRRYLRKRRLFRQYIRRDVPFYPLQGGTFKLNTEEMASLFHFPSKTVVPTPSVSRVEAKKGGASLELPIE